jgi:diaminopropionate ammonia-lyase
MPHLLNTRRPAAGAEPFSCDPAPAFDMLAHCPAYRETSYVALDGMARELGIAGLHVKSETERMGLGSFKALGGVYAVATIVRERAEAVLGRPVAPADLISEPVRDAVRDMVFACASAGNHGLAVATGARLFGARAVVHVAETVPESFVARLERAGARAARAGAIYEEAMQAAQTAAAEHGWILLADSSWPGYTDYPGRIMQGYCVLARELVEQARAGGAVPSHVFLQAGVGGMAAAVARYLRRALGEALRIVVVEPDAAPCLIESVRAGAMVRVEGPVSTMGRLDCKEASLIAFDALLEDADGFMTVSDDAAQRSTARLAGFGIASTPSGTAGLAGLVAALGDAAAARDFGLDAAAQVAVIASEARLRDE